MKIYARAIKIYFAKFEIKVSKKWVLGEDLTFLTAMCVILLTQDLTENKPQNDQFYS